MIRFGLVGFGIIGKVYADIFSRGDIHGGAFRPSATADPRSLNFRSACITSTTSMPCSIPVKSKLSSLLHHTRRTASLVKRCWGAACEPALSEKIAASPPRKREVRDVTVDMDASW